MNFDYSLTKAQAKSIHNNTQSPISSTTPPQKLYTLTTSPRRQHKRSNSVDFTPRRGSHVSLTHSPSSASSKNSSLLSSPISQNQAPTESLISSAPGRVIDLDKITHELNNSVRRLSVASSLSRIQENTLQNIVSNSNDQLEPKLPLSSELLLMKYQNYNTDDEILSIEEEQDEEEKEEQGREVLSFDEGSKAKSNRLLRTFNKLKRNSST